MVLAQRQALLCGQPIEGAFGVEDGIDLPHRFDGQWRPCELGELEEVAPAMALTQL
jgi:hypothetical protein